MAKFLVYHVANGEEISIGDNCYGGGAEGCSMNVKFMMFELTDPQYRSSWCSLHFNSVVKPEMHQVSHRVHGFTFNGYVST